MACLFNHTQDDSRRLFLQQVWVCWSPLVRSPRGSSMRCTSLSTSGTKRRECPSSLLLDFTRLVLQKLRGRTDLILTSIRSFRMQGSPTANRFGSSITSTEDEKKTGLSCLNFSSQIGLDSFLANFVEDCHSACLKYINAGTIRTVSRLWCSFISGVRCFGNCCKHTVVSIFMCMCVWHLQATLWRQPDCTKSSSKLRPIRYAAEPSCGSYSAPLCPARHTYTWLDPHTQDTDAPRGMGGEADSDWYQLMDIFLSEVASLKLRFFYFSGGAYSRRGDFVVSLLLAAGRGVLSRCHGAAGNVQPGGPVLPSTARLQTPAAGAVRSKSPLPVPGLQPPYLLHPWHSTCTQGAAHAFVALCLVFTFSLSSSCLSIQTPFFLSLWCVNQSGCTVAVWILISALLIIHLKLQKTDFLFSFNLTHPPCQLRL